MIPYIAYKHYQKKKQQAASMAEASANSSLIDFTDSNGSLTSSPQVSLLELICRLPLDEVTKVCLVHIRVQLQEAFSLKGVAAKRILEGEESAEEWYVNGKLSIIEKAHGIMIEWEPVEEDGWVLTNGDDTADATLSTSPTVTGDAAARTPPRNSVGGTKLQFSVDIKDLRSFQCVEPKKGKGCAWIRFISKDGTNYIPLYFRHGGISSFVEHLQRYATLKRSARESNLVLFTDERIEALEQSVSILNLNSDFFSRMVANPYATAMTGLGKVASFVQDQVIPSLLESDEVSAEEQIRAMRELRERDEKTTEDLRLHDDAGFELVTRLELPERPHFNREEPVSEEIWNSYKNPDGSFRDLHSLKQLIFRGGLNSALRKEAWKYLLGVYDWTKSEAENAAVSCSLSFSKCSLWTALS
ncbi:unnamed protein product [Anisakis simplex]|uniref:LD27216p (inferred by orthology to a D. melanogaster protein) n=1 Tax=Anisakis simplex TaxID=6269 RepID=A0A0M3IYP6_ANISI|nr:unnamed protein product [Anisakis simplex]